VDCILLAVYLYIWKCDRCWFNLWIGYCCLCIGRAARVTGFDLVCGLDIAGCVVVEQEDGQWLL
jgi:hypothetical protein